MIQQPRELKNEISQRISEIRSKNIHAPEFPKHFEWLNIDGTLSLKSLKGKLVLLDFWTYCCINCMHIIPDLKYLEEKYADEPLVVIGVHSAKFTNETEIENVRHAVLRYEIEHPVVLDEGHVIWGAFGVRAWPTLVLVDPEGYLIGVFSGEGNREILDAYIKVALEIYGNQNKLNNQPLQFEPEKNNADNFPLSYPGKIIADTTHNRLIISDSNHNRLLVVDENGEVLDIIGNRQIGFRDGKFESATFYHPQGMAFYKDDLFVADTENHAIRKISFTNRTVETIAGTGEQARQYNISGNSRTTPLNSPWDLFIQDDICYIAMAGSHQIWTLDLRTHEIAPYAGTGREARIDGHRLQAAFAQPSGITGDGEKLYIADSEISSVREIDIESEQVFTLVGGDLFDFGDRDGLGDGVRLQHPLGVLYHEGLVYLADTYNHKIKTIDPQTRRSTKYLGNGRGFRDGEKPKFYEPSGLAFLNGKLYIADTNNQQIRTIDVQSRKVTTLILKGLEKFEKEKQSKLSLATLPNTEYFELPSQKIKPNSSAEIEVNIKLPPNHKFNDGSPFQYFLRNNDELIGGDQVNAIQTLKNDLDKFSIIFKSGDRSGRGRMELELMYYYCENKDANICYVRSVIYNIPFEIKKQGDNKIIVNDMVLN
ncbi:MAG: redoxin domain-containing protein [bacterium]|nr:MAG: redoxin domain-containing protein [bacterium]